MTTMRVGLSDEHYSIRRAEELGAVHLRELLIVDRVTTSIAVLTLAVIGATTAFSAPMVALIALVAAMGVMRQLGCRSLSADRTDTAVFWFAAGSWGVAIGAVLIIPMALPIVVISVAIPAILSAMYQADAQVRAVTVGLVFVAGVVGTISRYSDGAGLEDPLHPNVVTLVFVGFLAAQNLPMVIAVRQASQQYRTALHEAQVATEAAQRAEREVTRSRARLAQATDSERRKIERDLHDGAQQLFVSALVQLRVFDQMIKRGRNPEPETIGAIANDLEEAIDELRRLARGIYPALLQARGLHEALQGLTRTSMAPATLVGDDPGRLPHEVETALYFFASEALQNVAKHAGAGAAATVIVTSNDDGVSVAVVDDGVGLSSNREGSGSQGMVNMNDRIAAVGGTLQLASEPGCGCSITASVPSSVDEKNLVGACQ